MRCRARLGIVAMALLGSLAWLGDGPVPDDSPAARRVAAEEFLTAVPVSEELDTLVQEISVDVAPDRRDWFIEQMNRQVDLAYVRRVMLDGLTAGLSTAELRAAARFYATPEGHAVRDKLPKVIDDIMPLIREELKRTVRRLPH